MINYITIAWSNLLRNRRRTVSTLAAISLGVGMVVFTNGFTNGISANMSNSVINQLDGHLHIEHKDYKKFFITDQEKILIPDYRTLAAQIMKVPHVKAVMPRIMLGGLIGVGEKNSTFFGTASDLATLSQVLPDYGAHLRSGKLLSADDPDGILLGEALANSLKVKVGDELVLLSKTVRGEQSNTLVHVRGTVTFPNDYVVEQSLVMTGLGQGLAENLLDLGNGATQLLVRVDDTDNVATTVAALEQYFEANKLPWRVTPWYDNPAYNRVVGIFNGIGALVMFLLLMMVGIITSNALLMAFFERMREIGTLRAIGMNRWQISLLLYLESAMVGMAGALAGLVLGIIMVGIARIFGIPLGLIGQSVLPVLKVSSLVVSTLVPVFFILVAATIPVRATNRMSVIDSLNYQ